MLIYNQLEIKEGNLYIDVSIPRSTIEEEDYFENVYFKDLKIYNQDTFQDSVCIYADEILNSYSYAIQEQEGNVQDFQITIPLKSIAMKNINSSILFICITTTGVPKENIPCYLDKNVWTRALLSFDDIYSKFIDNLKDIYNNSCIVPQNLMTFMLNYTALRMTLEHCDYELAVEIFNVLTNSSTVGKTKNCGCHG